MTERQKINLGALGIAIAASLGFYSYHAMAPNLIGIDGYFHTTFSRWIADNGLVYTFEWLPFTIYAENFVDDHLLFHILLSPFTGLGDITGGQVYATVMGSAVFVAFYLILANHRIRWPAVWTLALSLSCYSFIFRLFLFSILLLCLYLLVRRFIEYWPPFAFLFAAFAFQHWWGAAPARWRSHLHTGLWVVVPVVLALGAYQTTVNLLGTRAPSRPPTAYEGASRFLSRTVARDEIIFHSSWGDFPLLFHQNTQNRYIAGLGLHYLYLQDPETYETYVEICEGKQKDPASAIVTTFGSWYAFSRKDQGAFIASLDNDRDAERVYEDDGAVVFKLSAAR